MARSLKGNAVSIEAWLQQLGLPQYASLFAENDIDLDVLGDLNDQDLKELGISLGDRKRLLKAIAVAMAGASSGAAPGATAGTTTAPTAPALSRAERAERRQLTVMFCDLVGSTSLSVRLDPEDLRHVISGFQRCCEAVIARFGGNIARYMGDGLLVYFGYPTASEHDPESAVRAGKEIVRCVASLSLQPGLVLQTRIGIATGAVVVGDLIGQGAAREQAVVGETPNLARRLQGLADPDSVVISDATRRLIGNLFRCIDLGRHPVKGFNEPVPAWQVAEEAAVASRFEATHSEDRLSKLVGRDVEIERLTQSAARAMRGDGQVVLLIGEPGIGKSRLTLALREQLSAAAPTVIACSCTPHYQETALFPIIQWLERIAAFEAGDDPNVRLDKLERALARHGDAVASFAPLYASLLSIPAEHRYGPLELSPRLQKERTFEALKQQLSALAAERPVLVIFEDLHWADPSTLELLEGLTQAVKAQPILLLMTARPSFQPPRAAGDLALLFLNRLSQQEAAELVADVTGGKGLPAELVGEILDKADGVPLFLEELTKTMIESNQLVERSDRFELMGTMPELRVPSTLLDSLTARLDRLGSAKDVARIGAAIGRQFSYSLLSALVPNDPEGLTDALNRLTDSQLLDCTGVPPRCTYAFRHALIQDAAYSGLLLSERRELHRRIASALRQAEELSSRPEVLASHYTKAGEYRDAIPLWQEAAEQARRAAAHAEAIKHVKTALQLIGTLPADAERARLELQLHVALGINLEATGGYAAPEVAQTYARARELCEELEDATERVPALLGMLVFHLVRADLEVAHELAKQCMQLSESSGRPEFLIEAAAALGHVLPHLGAIEEGTPFLRRCIELSSAHRQAAFIPITAQDPAVLSLCQLGLVSWLQGYPDRAVAHIEEAVGLAEALNQPINLAVMCPYAAELHQLRRETTKAMRYAEMGVRIAAEHGYDYWHLLSLAHLGIAKAFLGDTVEGRTLTSSAVDRLRAAGAHANLTYFLCASADAALLAGDCALASGLLTEAFTMSERHHEQFFSSLLHEVRGRLRAAGPEHDDDGAEADFREAMAIAKAQNARSAELRACLGLHRLHISQGRQNESVALLETLFELFDEGFATRDLVEAAALLGRNGTAHSRMTAP